jgi:ribosomal biogenesis protein LAS1
MEILERGGVLVADRMEEDGKEMPGEGVPQDVEGLGAGLRKDLEEVDDEVEEMGRVEGGEEESEVDMVEEPPAWVLYEEEAWVPKPIGVV